VLEYYKYYQNEGLIHNFPQHINKKPHIITTSFEHHSVLNACKQLEDLGILKVTQVKPDPVTGTIDPKDILKYISNHEDDYQTILVSVMWVNKVLGTIQPIKEIGDICKQKLVKFHTDAVQAVGNIHIDLSEYNIDFMTVSGHKFHAPKGIGFVYIKDKTYLQPLISGGGQEYGLRAGTENLPYIKAITYCLEKYNTKNHIDSKLLYIENLKQKIFNEFEDVKGCIFFMSSKGIGTLNIAFKDLISDMLVYNLGERGYMVSVGSACDNGNFENSHVLTSVNYSEDYINSNIRITFNEFNTVEEINSFIEVLKEEVYKMRGY
jgi:cysteine desulfurase